MNQLFFQNTIQSKFIKNLLLNTSLPIINSVQDGDYIITGFSYLYNNYIIKCSKSGVLGNTDDNQPHFDILKNDFVFGRTYIRNTNIFESSSNTYDSDTHRYLGEYLRFYRDIFKTNLMPFYNCFNGQYTSKFYIDNSSLTVKQNPYDYYKQGGEEFNSRYYYRETFKVIQVPIKFNKKYTIALDCNANVIIAPCFINHGQLIKCNYGGVNIDLTTEFNKRYSSIHVYSNINFKHPVVEEIINQDTNLLSTASGFENIVLPRDLTSLSLEQLFQRYEKYLYLLIQLPNDNSSSITILEGDYTNLDCNEIFNIEEVDLLDNKTLDYLCKSNLSLLNINDNTRYPYANRLIEYLLWNVIDNNEEIGDNVYRIQKIIGINEDVHTPGYYDNYLRAKVFTNFKESNKYVNLDINGYVDKDIESFLYT